MKSGETVLIHAGGSGVGTAAVQLVKLAGAIPIVTAGSQTKIDTAKALGAQHGFNYKTEDFAEKVFTATQGKWSGKFLSTLLYLGIICPYHYIKCHTF